MTRLFWFPINNLRNPYGWKLILVVSITSSCVFDDDKENFVEVDPTPNLQFSSELTYNFDGFSNYPMLDTLLMLRESNIEFLFPFGNIYGYEIYSNQTMLSNGEGSRFSLNGARFEDGFQQVVIVQYAKSGTNSLRDQLNLEVVAYADTFALKVVDTPPEIPIINNASFEDGNLVVKWNKYNDLGFQGYQIERTYGRDSDVFESTVNDQDVSEWSDPLYIGNDATYTVNVDLGGLLIESASYTYESEYKPNFKIVEHSGSQYLAWSKPLFSGNISSYTLFQDAELLSETIPGTDTSFLLNSNPQFGEIPPTYTLRIYSKIDNESEKAINFGLRDRIGVGIAVPPHNSIVYNAANEKYYCLFEQKFFHEHYSEGFYEMNEDLEVTNYHENIVNSFNDSYQLVLSPDGESLYQYTFVNIDKINMNTLQSDESIHTVRSNNFLHGWKYSASNNGLVTSYEDNYDYSFRVHDFATANIIFDSARYSGISHLSFEGDLLILENSLYEYTDGTFEFMRTLDFEDVRYSRFINDSNDILIVTDTNIHLYNLEGDSIIKSIPVTLAEDTNFTETKFYFEPADMQLIIREPTGGWKFVHLENENIRDEDVIAFSYAGDYLFVSRIRSSYPGYAKKIND